MSEYPKLSLGRHSYACNPQFRGSMSKVIVGNFTSIAEGVVFDCGFNHNIKNVTTFPLNKPDSILPGNIKNRGDIIIGNDVYIGEGATIMSGVRIGDGAVIGTGTVVYRNIAPFEVTTSIGNSWFRFVGSRVADLLGITWWNWPDERILANAELLLSEDIDNFINNYV